MTVIVKTMSAQNMPDSNSSKGFSLIIVPESHQVAFSRDYYGEPMLSIRNGTSEVQRYSLSGNSYVMENNRTISTFAHSEVFDNNTQTECFKELQVHPWFNVLSDSAQWRVIRALMVGDSIATLPTHEGRYIKTGISVPPKCMEDMENFFKARLTFVEFTWSPSAPHMTSYLDHIVYPAPVDVQF